MPCILTTNFFSQGDLERQGYPFCLAFSSFPGYTFSMRDFILFCLI